MRAIDVPPSLLWEGSLGPWSSFLLRIGTPATRITVLPATSKSNIWAVLPSICPNLTALDDCESFRGGLFDPKDSKTYQKIVGEEPLFELPFNTEESLGYEGNASFGTDVVGIGGADANGHFLQQQAIATFALTRPFMAGGLLGLSDQPLNVTGIQDRHESPLSTLRQTKQIPSSFYGYNAGARYRDPVKYASLTFGGYDAGRGGPLKDALQIQMQPNNFLDLAVSLQTISVGGQSATTDPMTAYVDSVVPEIWLPQSACGTFEDVFGLEYDETSGMYFLEDDQASYIRSSTKTVDLTVADPADPSETLRISLPAGAFVLEATFPYINSSEKSSVPYFALRRAFDPGQVFLGHTFLQEAYLAVDYDGNVFYLSQADLQKEQDIETVFPDEKKTLSTGAIAGIAVGVVAIAVIAGALMWWFLCRPRIRKRRNSRFRARMESQNAGLPDSQMPPAESMEMHEFYGKRPFSVESEYKQELDAATTARGSIVTRAEMDTPPASGGASPRSKMSPRRTSYGFPSSPVELESCSPRMMHSRTASGSSIEPMSPLSGNGRTELPRTEEEDVHELP